MSGKQVPKREIKGFICYSSLKQILKVATTEATTCTLHLTICSRFGTQSLSLGLALVF